MQVKIFSQFCEKINSVKKRSTKLLGILINKFFLLNSSAAVFTVTYGAFILIPGGTHSAAKQVTFALNHCSVITSILANSVITQLQGCSHNLYACYHDVTPKVEVVVSTSSLNINISFGKVLFQRREKQ